MAQTNPWTETLIRQVELGDRESVCVCEQDNDGQGERRERMGEREWKRETERGPLM